MPLSVESLSWIRIEVELEILYGWMYEILKFDLNVEYTKVVPLEA